MPTKLPQPSDWEGNVLGKMLQHGYLIYLTRNSNWRMECYKEGGHWKSHVIATSLVDSLIENGWIVSERHRTIGSVRAQKRMMGYPLRISAKGHRAYNRKWFEKKVP